MSFCKKCGKLLPGRANMCSACYAKYRGPGAPSSHASSTPAKPAPKPAPKPVKRYNPGDPFEIVSYQGHHRKFSFMGAQLNISADVDAVNYYRSTLAMLARVQADAFKREYNMKVRDITSFLAEYPDLFSKYRRPLVDAVMRFFMKIGLYDISVDMFDQMHLDICSGPESYEKIVGIVEEAIEDNREAKIQKYESMPNLFFYGTAGVAAAFAYNAIVNKIAENDISKDDLSDADRYEFNKILEDERDLFTEGIFIDYSNIYIPMTQVLFDRGILRWRASEYDDRRCEGLCRNLEAGVIPTAQIPQVVVEMLQLNPFHNLEQMNILHKKFGHLEEMKKILNYFGYYLGPIDLSKYL